MEKEESKITSDGKKKKLSDGYIRIYVGALMLSASE
jgi:hypothetical protein